MFASLTRLLSITIGVLILFVLVVFLMRGLGAQQAFNAPPHPWFEVEQWNFVDYTPETDVALGPKRIQRITIERRAGGWVVKEAGDAPVLDVLRAAKGRDWLMVLSVNETPDLDNLVDNLSKLDRTYRFAIDAPAQKVARYLRKQAPQWVFAADTASLLRLHLFTSLYLESIMEFWPDFVIASNSKTNGSRLSENEVRELHRRKKRVVWDERQAPMDVPFELDGRMTTRP